MSTSTIHEAARNDAPEVTARLRATGMVRFSSAQATRRAVLHVQAAGDPAVPADMTSWFTERGFQFYVAGVQIPLDTLSARHAERDLQSVFADLDAASDCLRGADGMVSVVVTARGRAAFAAALWSAQREATDGRQANALILSEPLWPARASLRLNITCPVLVVDARADVAAGMSQRLIPPRQSLLRPGRLSRSGPHATQLGRHVTWLALADEEADRQLFLNELGRWLGAYMYGLGRDRLL